MDEIVAEILANPLVGAAGTALAGTAIALWLAAAWWAYRDAGRRTESSFAAYLASAWIVASTPLLLPMSLLIYRAARPQVAASEVRATALARALAATHAAGPACTGCGVAVDPAWLRCPDCATWLAAPCGACGAWSDPTFDLCPWCGGDLRDAPTPTEVAAAVADATPDTAPGIAGHGTAAANGVSAAAVSALSPQRRAISSARPLSYAASRDTWSASS
jgi:hypothetical protein